MRMDLKLQDKVIIVSGGAKGIGEGIVRVLAKEGAVPFIIGRNVADNLAAVGAVEAAGGKAFQVEAELTVPEQCAAAVATVMGRCGRIDGLVNNAGVNDGVGLEKGSYAAFME
ncbi:MAG TPA: SDR family NAD(P)-dependent oxidoreductase, partial [Puia sp.]|nr:SDR family NAD(P)-dependent oxidoreductase [Puia sp.]